MVIGIDFDNTVVSYDRLFRVVALEQGLSLPHHTTTKERICDYLRTCDDGELQWRRLQAVVYGARIADAEIVDGVGEFLQLCRGRDVPTYIVSHKTEMTPYADPPLNLRTAALRWMTSGGFFRPDGFGLGQEDVFFASSRAEKIEQIRTLKCTHFIDDLEAVLLDPLFPPTVEGLLYAPARTPAAGATIRTFGSWAGIRAHLFGSFR
jgi:hypothetical protein